MMIPYIYVAKLSAEIRRHIVENARLMQATMAESVEAFDGRVIRCHLSASSGDPAGILEFPDDTSARAWGLYYGSMDGVRSYKLKRLIADDELLHISGLLERAKARIVTHSSE